MIVLYVISPFFKGEPEIKVKKLQSQWDQWGGLLSWNLTIIFYLDMKKYYEYKNTIVYKNSNYNLDRPIL